MARLCYKTASGEQLFTLGDSFSVGRLETNSLPLPEDRAVSREHAVVECTSGVYILRDLQSSNGTFVQRGEMKMRVAPELTLEPGDVIEIGGARLVFEDQAAPQMDSEMTSVPGQTVVGRVLPVPKPEPEPKE